MFEICSLYLESLMKMFHYILLNSLIDCSSFFHLMKEKEIKKEKEKQKKIHY